MADQHEEFDGRLKQVGLYNEHNLAANRAGILSKEQQVRLSREREIATNVLFAVLFIMLIVASMFLITALSQRARGDGVSIAVLACVALCLAGIIYLYRQRLKKSDDLNTLKVIATKGPIKHEKYRHNRKIYYGIISRNETFKVSQQRYDAFTEGETYILYYISPMKLIAAEHISGLIPPSEEAPPQTSNPLTSPSPQS